MARDIHVVPLSPEAVLLLEQIHAITGKFDLVFALDAKPWKTAVREHGECRAQDDGLRDQVGYLRPRVPGHGVQCACRIRAVVEDGYRTADEPQGTQQHAGRLYPQGRAPRRAPNDHDLVGPVSGDEPRGPCDAARVCQADGRERHAPAQRQEDRVTRRTTTSNSM